MINSSSYGTTVNNLQFSSCLTPTSIPVQIWPDPVQTSELDQKIVSFRFETDKLISGVNFQKIYKFIVIFAIISAILSNSYFIVTKLTPHNNSIPKTNSVASSAVF